MALVGRCTKGIQSYLCNSQKNLNIFISPDWYYDIEYIKERERGYDSTEDLFVPGYFDIQLKAGESVVISTSLKEENPSYIKRQWISEIIKTNTT